MKQLKEGRGLPALLFSLLLAACAHDPGTTGDTYRGEPVGVNAVSPSTADAKSAPVVGSVHGAIEPAPSAMATTAATDR